MEPTPNTHEGSLIGSQWPQFGARFGRDRACGDLGIDATQTKQSEAQWKKLLDTLPTLAWCSHPDGSIEFVNKRWRDYTGFSQEKARGCGWKAAIHNGDLQSLLEKWRVSLAPGTPAEAEARLRRFDGEFRWFLFRMESLKDESGKVIRWYGINTEIENLKQAEQKLRHEERELRRIVDAIPQTIIVQDSAGIPTYANKAVLDYAGVTTEQVLTAGFRERIFHHEDFARVREQRLKALQGGVPFEIEQRARRHDGQYRWFRIRYNPFHDEQGRVTRWYATGTDIEDEKQIQDRMQSEMLALREDIVRTSMFEEVVGSSEPVRKLLTQVSKVAPTDSTVLILGETGTGKELIARAIHERSARSARAFIRVNCAAIPQALIASELFGHEKGAFTGAIQRRLGRFESAHGGTIFLDEIGELPPETQVALLRVLQEREFERVGGSQTIPINVRVIAATNRDLHSAIADGTFREDLFYRLNVIPVRLPPLRERQGDIRLLVEYFVNRFASKSGKQIRRISRRTLEFLESYGWPGNIRELQNVIERAVILCDGEILSIDEAWLTPAVPRASAGNLASMIGPDQYERNRIESALREAKGRISGPDGAAVKLGMPRQTLESKIGRLRIDLYSFKSS